MKRFLKKNHAEVFFLGCFVAITGASAVMVSIPVGVAVSVTGLIGMGFGIYGIATT